MVGLMVVTTSPPGCRRRLRSFQNGSAVSVGSVPASTPSSVLSTSVVPYVCEEYPVTGAYTGPWG